LAYYRARAWVLFAFFGTGLVVCLIGVLSDPSTLPSYALSLAGMLVVFHGLPQLLGRGPPSDRMVGSHGNSWRVGRYTEADLRALVDEVVAVLPGADPSPQVFLLDDRAPRGAAWERFPWFLFGPSDRRIGLTSGSLHYLDPDEVKAVLLHEIGHLRPECRLVPVNLTLLADLALHAFAIWCYPRIGSLTVALLVFFLFARVIVQASLQVALARAGRLLEHACDLFAGNHIGEAAMINALLKIGEDDELTETLMARVATRLRRVKYVFLEDIAWACRETRPYGRIFHRNLFRHASAAVAKLVEQDGLPEDQEREGSALNGELRRFLARRRCDRRPRVRWRALDDDGDGSLEPGEIARLCQALRERPGHVLVASEGERFGETHPSFRSRVLVLHEHAVERGTHPS